MVYIIIGPGHTRLTLLLLQFFYLKQSTYNRASDVPRMYVSHVLDRKVLERLMSSSQKSQVMFAFS